MLTWETDAIEARASPRNPMVPICIKSSSERILLVACLSNAVSESSEAIPHPLSVILINCFPPLSISITIEVEPASKRVLDQFFYNRYGALDDFTGCNFVDNLLWKEMNDSHECLQVRQKPLPLYLNHEPDRCCIFRVVSIAIQGGVR